MLRQCTKAIFDRLIHWCKQCGIYIGPLARQLMAGYHEASTVYTNVVRLFLTVLRRVQMTNPFLPSGAALNYLTRCWDEDRRSGAGERQPLPSNHGVSNLQRNDTFNQSSSPNQPSQPFTATPGQHWHCHNKAYDMIWYLDLHVMWSQLDWLVRLKDWNVPFTDIF